MTILAARPVAEDSPCAPDLASLGSAAILDALETAIRGTVDDEATWLETQLAVLRRTILLLRPLSGDEPADPRSVQVERVLQLVTASFRERLARLDASATALRTE